MTSGKYFNKGVKALDSPDIGHIVRETPDKIVVFGGKHERYDISVSEIQQVGANVLIGLSLKDIVNKYKVTAKSHYLQVAKTRGRHLLEELTLVLMKRSIQNHYLIRE